MRDPGRQVCGLNPGFLKPEPHRWASRQTRGPGFRLCREDEARRASRAEGGGVPNPELVAGMLTPCQQST